MKRKILRTLLWILLIVAAFIAIGLWRNWEMIQRTMLGGLKVYETEAPAIPGDIKHPAILVFSKTNGFRHVGAIPAANAMLAAAARENDWGYFQTENGATFNPELLKKFDAVVFNNVSGDVFTPVQRAALKAFLENGGGFVGIHGSGGDPAYDWKWYVEGLIGAQFIGHPMNPQFQQATVQIEDNSHPATMGLPATLSRIDEWYSFEKSARQPGYHVLATIDEATYANRKMFTKDLTMGSDHPLVWWHCVGKGRVFYSAMGHQPEAYSEPDYRKLLIGAIGWAMRQDGTDCSAPDHSAR